MRELTLKEAEVFAALLHSGVPMATVVKMFLQKGEKEEEARAAWSVQDAVRKAIAKLDDGKAWFEWTDKERHERSLARHYNSLAYYLWSTNYPELAGEARAKADVARQALEAKIAGTAGQNDPMTEFYRDVLAEYRAKKKREIREEAVN